MWLSEIGCACAKRKTHSWILSSLFNEPKEQSVFQPQSLANDCPFPLSSSCLDPESCQAHERRQGIERKGHGTDPVTWLNSFLKQEKKIQGTATAFTLFIWPREKHVYLASVYGWVCSTHISSLEAEPVMILVHHCVLMVPQIHWSLSRQHCNLDGAQTGRLKGGVRSRQTCHSPTCHVRRPAEGWDEFQALLTTTSSITFPRNNSLTRNMVCYWSFFPENWDHE